jgi:3-hydroxyisobutyrate dehydrogenase-like beta-hydroxyacid dehydrogenase
MTGLRVAVVGCGVIGGGLARRLLALGHTVRCFDISPAALAGLVAAGAQRATSAADAVAGMSFCLVSLPRDEDVLAAFGGPDGVLAGLAPDTVVVETSTVPADCARDLAPRVAERGGLFVDAPLCPSPGADALDLTAERARGKNLAGVSTEAGLCTYFVGADETAFARAEPLLAEIGETFDRLGPVGAGKTAKLLHNAINLGAVALISEMLAVGNAAGLDVPKLVATLTHSLADSRMMRAQVARFIATDTFPDGLFPLTYGRKDLGYAADLAARLDCADELVTTVRDLFGAACAAGHGAAYTPGIYRYLRDDRSSHVTD